MDGDFRIGEWLIQPQLNRIGSAEKTVVVEPKVMEVLVYLARHAGEVLSKDRIIQAVWADAFVTDDVLTGRPWFRGRCSAIRVYTQLISPWENRLRLI